MASSSAGGPEDPSSPSPDGSDTCHFMRLPVEMRLEIYGLALTFHTHDTLDADLSKGRPHSPPLMLASKTIRDEMLEPYEPHLRTLQKAIDDQQGAREKEMEDRIKSINEAMRSNAMSYIEWSRECDKYQEAMSQQYRKFAQLSKWVVNELLGVEKELRARRMVIRRH